MGTNEKLIMLVNQAFEDMTDEVRQIIIDELNIYLSFKQGNKTSLFTDQKRQQIQEARFKAYQALDDHWLDYQSLVINDALETSSFSDREADPTVDLTKEFKAEEAQLGPFYVKGLLLNIYQNL